MLTRALTIFNSDAGAGGPSPDVKNDGRDAVMRKVSKLFCFSRL